MCVCASDRSCQHKNPEAMQGILYRTDSTARSVSDCAAHTVLKIVWSCSVPYATI